MVDLQGWIIRHVLDLYLVVDVLGHIEDAKGKVAACGEVQMDGRRAGRMQCSVVRGMLFA